MAPLILIFYGSFLTTCQHTGKWKKFSYIQAFYYLSFKPKPSVLASCLLDHMFLAIPSELEERSTSSLDPVNELLFNLRGQLLLLLIILPFMISIWSYLITYFLKSAGRFGSRPDYWQTIFTKHMQHTLRGQKPHWYYTTPSGILARDWFLTCLLAGLWKAALKPVNYTKLSEDIRRKILLHFWNASLKLYYNTLT